MQTYDITIGFKLSYGVPLFALIIQLKYHMIIRYIDTDVTVLLILLPENISIINKFETICYIPMRTTFKMF